MSKVLYIESSPRKKRSASIGVSKVFLEAYQKSHPTDEMVYLDLWQKDLPPFDGNIIDAKYAIMHGEPHSEEQKRDWKKVEDLIEEFKSADKYIISLAMWNYGIPYKLKHYIDLLVQPGYTFSYSPETGYKGLVTDKKILLIYARGGAYGAETGEKALDLQIPYMETILKFIGFKEFESIVIEPTLAGNEEKRKTVQQGEAKAKELAAKF